MQISYHTTINLSLYSTLIAAKEVTIADSVKINDTFKSGEDANFFQHEPFMKQTAKRLNTDFVMLNRSYTTITELYSKRLKIK